MKDTLERRLMLMEAKLATLAPDRSEDTPEVAYSEEDDYPAMPHQIGDEIPVGTTRYQTLSWKADNSHNTWQPDWVRFHA